MLIPVSGVSLSVYIVTFSLPDKIARAQFLPDTRKSEMATLVGRLVNRRKTGTTLLFHVRDTFYRLSDNKRWAPTVHSLQEGRSRPQGDSV